MSTAMIFNTSAVSNSWSSSYTLECLECHQYHVTFTQVRTRLALGCAAKFTASETVTSNDQRTAPRRSTYIFRSVTSGHGMFALANLLTYSYYFVSPSVEPTSIKVHIQLQEPIS